MKIAQYLAVRFAAALVAAAEPRSDAASTSEQIALGKKTAEAVCQSCHLMPDPALLDKETWVKHALPYMEPWLGRSQIRVTGESEAKRVREAGAFPQAPVLSDKQWTALNAYFHDASPMQTPAATNRPLAKSGLTLFQPRRLRTSGGIPATTLALIDTNRHCIYVGDAQERTLKLVNLDGEPLRAVVLPSAPVDVLRINSEMWVPLVGRIFPSDEWAGQLRKVSETGGGWASEVLLSGLPRVAHVSLSDLDADGRKEMIVAGFGHRVGKLMLWQKRTGGEFEETTLSPLPGAIGTHIEDLDGDGRLDILLFRGQAREGVFAFYNRGDHFDEKSVIEFPATYGVSHWQILDFDRDGKTDLLICNGDIGDYPAKPRAYHGLRLFLGMGGGEFKEKWSYPLNGAYGARVADFDGDGDLDIAAISFFPDYQASSEESFVFLQNQGNFRFEPFTFPFANEGRWLVMDAGDIDGDGDIDITLGSFAKGPQTIFIPDNLTVRWSSNRISVLFLENTKQ